MRVWIIDAAALPDKETLYTWAAAALPLPPYYGGNLDALHDVLCELGTDTCITVEHAEELPHRFGRWGQSVLCLLKQAREENHNVHVDIC